MYRIMIAKSKRDNYESMYQFMTTTTDGVTTPLEIKSKEELDAKIEKMLNEGGYSKADFIVMEVVDYSIDATKYSDDKASPDTTPTAPDDGGGSDDSTDSDIDKASE